MEGDAMSAPRMKDIYENQVRKQLIEKFGYKNAMQVPRIDKIVINMGVGEAAQDSKKVQSAATELAAITGQKPVTTKARKAIANFKLREGQAVGCKVTLRRQHMYERSEERRRGNECVSACSSRGWSNK